MLNSGVASLNMYAKNTFQENNTDYLLDYNQTEILMSSQNHGIDGLQDFMGIADSWYETNGMTELNFISPQ